VQRCNKLARFPVLETPDQFDQHSPTRINRPLVQELFHLDFVARNADVVFISGAGLGKSHSMTALDHTACLHGHSVLFTGAIDVINSLAAAQAGGSIEQALNHCLEPSVLCFDEPG
jgi:DNA replication protein DnaC